VFDRDGTIRFERDELYQLVWSVPRSRLSEQFGISDVAITKICKKLEVPVPPRGYWALTCFEIVDTPRSSV